MNLRTLDTLLHNQQGDAIALLDTWIRQRIGEDEYTWLSTQIRKSIDTNSGKELFITLGMIPRRIGKADLELSEAELNQAEHVRPGWNPSLWNLSGSTRILVLALLARNQSKPFGPLYRDLCRTADLTESLELYSALPLLPSGTDIDQQVGDGLRTNMKSVFESIAHRNPYPKENFSDNRWNHLVLKALFVESTLAPIQGLDERANDELAGILCDYARERRAAGRLVSCELWRCVGPFATGDRLNDLQLALDSDSETESQSAAIALACSPDPAATGILSTRPELRDAVNEGCLQWTNAFPVPVMSVNKQRRYQ